MNGLEVTYSALKADTALVALLTTVGGGPAITTDNPEPTTWEPSYKTCSIYQGGVRDFTLEYMSNTITANCRAGDSSDALEIAGAVVAALNRKSITGGGRFYCRIFPPIPPSDPVTDSYNVPVEILIKGQIALT